MVRREDVHAVQALIDAGADVDAQGDTTETPLHIATRAMNAQIITMLLEAGANPDLVSEFGETPRVRADAIGGEMRKLFKGH